MASTSSDRPVRLIRVQPNPVFHEPKHLPVKPLTHAPIEIERPSDYLKSCIHRADFKDIHPDLLKDYAKHYNIDIDHEKILRAEIMAVLCMKNEWIPILPEHDATHTADERVLLSSNSNQAIPEGDGDEPTTADSGAEDEAYIPDRFRTPEDTYDDDTGSTEAADPNANNSDDDVTGDTDFDTLPPVISLGDLAGLTSRLQARHTNVQSTLKAATAATRQAAANVFEMMARLKNETAKIKKIMGTVYDIVGECDEQNEPKEGMDKEVDEEGERNIVSEKRKGKERATDPIRSSARSLSRRESKSAGLRSSPLCPNCRVARDLTVSQHHSLYLCAEHMPNPYQANGASNEESRVPTSARGSSSRSARKNKRYRGSLLDPSSSRDSTIIFGLTTKPVETSSSSSKGKKRSLEENEADSHSTPNNQSPKRPRVEASQNDTQNSNSQQNLSSNSTPVPKKAAPLARTKSVCDISEQGVESMEASESRSGTPLRRSYCIYDLDDPVETAFIASMEDSSSSLPRRDVPLPRTTSPNNLDVPEVITNAERRPSTPRRNAPLRRTISVVDINDAEEMANAEREVRREMRPTRRGQSNLTTFVSRQPPSSRRNAPLRRTISIHDINDPEEVANAEKEENPPPRGTADLGPTESIDGEEPATVHSPKPRTNEPLRRSFSITDINDPTEVAGVETLTTARATPQGRSEDVSRRVRERLTASAESTSSGSSSNIIRGKRPRDSDGDEEEGMQKKTKTAEASN